MIRREDALARCWLPALFWGSVWGFWEATAGHALHLARVPGLAGFIMFPAGFVMMSRAFAGSGKPAVIFMTACVAASVKLTDLLLSGVDVCAVINPIQAILLESLAVIGLYSMSKRSGRLAWHVPVLASFSWRAAHLLSGVVSMELFSARNFLQTGSAAVFEIFILDGLVSGILIFIVSGVVMPARNTDGIHEKA